MKSVRIRAGRVNEPCYVQAHGCNLADLLGVESGLLLFFPDGETAEGAVDVAILQAIIGGPWIEFNKNEPMDWYCGFCRQGVSVVGRETITGREAAKDIVHKPDCGIGMALKALATRPKPEPFEGAVGKPCEDARRAADWLWAAHERERDRGGNTAPPGAIAAGAREEADLLHCSAAAARAELAGAKVVELSEEQVLLFQGPNLIARPVMYRGPCRLAILRLPDPPKPKVRPWRKLVTKDWMHVLCGSPGCSWSYAGTAEKMLRWLVCPSCGVEFGEPRDLPGVSDA